MGQVVKMYMGLLFLLLEALTGMGVVAAGMQTAAARDYHSDIIKEVACSNFNENVMEACVIRAEEDGYQLQIEPVTYDEAANIKLASVTLNYEYAIPVLNLFSKHEIHGVAG